MPEAGAASPQGDGGTGADSAPPRVGAITGLLRTLRTGLRDTVEAVRSHEHRIARRRERQGRNPRG
eukprot:7935828-Alexandrium_andersonii.AAC.1